MLRALVALLLLANLAFYAWTEGWLDGVVGSRPNGDREPERLQRQVRPEAVRLLPAGAASEAASAASSACFEAGPFDAAALVAAQASAQTLLPAGAWATVRTESPGTWIVYMGRFTSREALSKKEDEIKRRKLPYEEIRDHPALAPGLSLGRFDAPAAAAQALEQFTQQGVRTARVAELAPPSSRFVLRVARADTALAGRLVALKGGAFGTGFAACGAGLPGT